MEQRRVLMTLLQSRPLNAKAQRQLLSAARAIESNAECAAVLNAFLDRYEPADPEIRAALLAALETVASNAERRRLRARLATVPS